jgi:hypothetical protein
MHGSLGKAAHPQQPFFQLFQIAFEMAFHSLRPLHGKDYTARDVAAILIRSGR